MNKSLFRVLSLCLLSSALAACQWKVEGSIKNPITGTEYYPGVSISAEHLPGGGVKISSFAGTTTYTPGSGEDPHHSQIWDTEVQIGK